MTKMDDIIKRTDAALEKAKEKGDVPDLVWKKCKGVGIITCSEMGLLVSVTQGDGLLMMHNEDGTWGAPSALSMGGFGVGAVLGKADKQIFLFPMTKLGVDLLAGENSVKLGLKAGVAAGPGREGEVGASFGTGGVGVIHSYVFQEGILLDVSLASTAVCAENNYNKEFYGKKVSAEDILTKADAVDIPKGKGVEELQSKLSELSK